MTAAIFGLTGAAFCLVTPIGGLLYFYTSFYVLRAGVVTHKTGVGIPSYDLGHCGIDVPVETTPICSGSTQPKHLYEGRSN